MPHLLKGQTEPLQEEQRTLFETSFFASWKIMGFALMPHLFSSIFNKAQQNQSFVDRRTMWILLIDFISHHHFTEFVFIYQSTTRSSESKFQDLNVGQGFGQ